MVKTVYSDINVFDCIRRRDKITDDNANALKDAVKSGKISILLSIPLIEEALILLKVSPDIAKEMCKLITNLTEGSKVLKHPQELLRDDVRSYALGTSLSERFTEEFSDLVKYLDPEETDIEGRLAVVDQIQKAKNEVQESFQMAKTHDSSYYKSLPKSSRPNFKKYYSAHAIQVVEDLARKVGVLSECTARGLDGLLQISSVQLYVAAHLSLGYAQTREGQGASLGDWHDMQHAVLASAADIFVTQDGNLAKNLNRISIKTPQVISLQELLQQIS